MAYEDEFGYGDDVGDDFGYGDDGMTMPDLPGYSFDRSGIDRPAQDAGSRGTTDPVYQTQAPSVSPSGYSYQAEPRTTVNPIAQQVAQLDSTSDPAERAMQRDQLARNLYSTLQQNGHDVKWSGDQLIVDGRPYDVAGASGGQSLTRSGAVNPNPAQSGRYTWNAVQNHETQTSDPSAANFNPRDAAIENVAGNWYDYLDAESEKFLTEHGWDPFHPSDLEGVIRNMSYAGNTQPDSYWLQNVLSQWQQRNSNEPGGGGGGGGEGGGGSAMAGRSWEPLDALNDLRFGDTMGRLKPYQFSGFRAGGGTGGELDELVMSILQNPESLPPAIVDKLKAKAKDELAEMQGTRDADLVGQRYQLGYENDSPFFMSERNAGRRSYDDSLIKSNRDIDTAAAATNMADKRAAATMGTSYKMGEEGLKEAASDSVLRSNSLAGDLALRRAAVLTNDRQFDATYGLNMLGLQNSMNDSAFARWMALFGGV